MMDSISNVRPSQPPPPGGGARGGQPLSEEQSALIESTLSEFDSSNLSEDDAKSIISAFSEAGIKPGKEMASAMEELGFDARKVGDLGGAERRPPEGPPPAASGSGASAEGLEALDSILEKFGSSELNSDEQKSVLDMLEKHLGQSASTGSVFDIEA